MAHEFESGFVLRDAAWHGLATVVQEALSASEAIREAGLGWIVIKEPVHRPSGEVIPDLYSTVRMSDDSVLGHVGGGYEVIQNEELFKFFDSVFDRDEGRYYHTAGSLKQGRVVWILAKLPGDFYVTPQDEVRNYVLLASSHDMSLSLTAMHTPIRVVCNNTLSMALGNRAGARAVKIRHTRNYEASLREASKVLGLAQRRVDVMRDVVDAMVRRQVKPKDVGLFLEKIFPDRNKVDSDKKMPKRTADKRRDVLRLFTDSETNNLKGIEGSVWSLYNAVTEYCDHDYPTRGATADPVYRSWFGTADAVKVQASSLLANYARTGAFA